MWSASSVSTWENTETFASPEDKSLATQLTMVGYSQGRKRRRNAAGNAPADEEVSQDSPATPAPAADSSTITVAEPMDVLSMLP